MQSLAQRVLAAYRERGATLALAESCTGGLVSAKLTSIPGAGDSFRGTVVSYADEVKVNVLGVDEGVLAREGAVSAVVARGMAEGARERVGADVAISITGFAGPNVPPGCEVGLVFFGVATRSGTSTRELRFSPPRERVREEAAEHALGLALEALLV